MKSEQEVTLAVERYADMVRRVGFYHLKNRQDTEDLFQNVFLKYLLSGQHFRDAEHEKAWVLRVAINACKDHQRLFFNRHTVSMEVLAEEPAAAQSPCRELLLAVLALPPKYKDPIYLHYYEGYTTPEIAQLLGKKENSVYTLLSRGRALLKNQLGGDEFGTTVQGRP